MKTTEIKVGTKVTISTDTDMHRFNKGDKGKVIHVFVNATPTEYEVKVKGCRFSQTLIEEEFTVDNH